MKKTKNLLAIVAMMLLIAMLSVMGTVAWLVAETAPVENTFTVGEIEITLTETWNTDSNEDGILDTWTAKIIPGSKVDKDPKVTVLSGSEKCWVFVSVENNLVIDNEVVGTLDINTTDWISVGTKDNKTVYRYKDVVDAASADVPLQVFNKVTISGEVTEKNIDTLNNAKVIIDAYAHQSENIGSDSDSESVATAAALKHFGITD